MIIFGLGNPGFKYRWTRHNAGFIFLDRLAKKFKKRFVSYPEYKKATIIIEKREIRLIKPLSFMNRSGMVVSHILKKYPDEFIIILDDINLPLGRMRFRAKGSDGGHLGLRSIIEALNTEDFPRLRIGIANQEIIERKINSADFVLSPFRRNEKKIIIEVIEKAIEGIEMYLTQGFERAQSFINGLIILPEVESKKT
ncbi:MAG: aminoacyl-tRNA hydrolase [candidate division WOR-3 bacterium]